MCRAIAAFEVDASGEQAVQSQDHLSQIWNGIAAGYYLSRQFHWGSRGCIAAPFLFACALGVPPFRLVQRRGAVQGYSSSGRAACNKKPGQADLTGAGSKPELCDSARTPGGCQAAWALTLRSARTFRITYQSGARSVSLIASCSDDGKPTIS
jgi:hypothetical protein